MIQKSKVCTKCKIEKLLDEFSPDKQRKDGKQYWCKECRKFVCAKYRLKNKKKIIEKTKKRQQEHRVEIAIKNKKWREKHKEKLKIQRKQYYEKHKNKANNYQKNRRKINIRFKIQCNLANRVRNTIKGNSKSLPTMFLIGCEHDYLMFHLQSQFQSGMSWDNYGKWHMDHIRPCASFDLSKPEEQQKCFNYSNLQPLWAKDNQIKNDKYIEYIKI